MPCPTLKTPLNSHNRFFLYAHSFVYDFIQVYDFCCTLNMHVVCVWKLFTVKWFNSVEFNSNQKHSCWCKTIFDFLFCYRICSLKLKRIASCMTVSMELAASSWARWHHRRMQSCCNGVSMKWTIVGIISNRRALQSGRCLMRKWFNHFQTFPIASPLARFYQRLWIVLNYLHFTGSFSQRSSAKSFAQCLRSDINSDMIYTVGYSQWNHYI